MNREEIISKQCLNKELAGHGMAQAKWEGNDVIAISRGNSKHYDSLENITINPAVEIDGVIFYWGTYPKDQTNPLSGARGTKLNKMLLEGGKLYLYSDNLIKKDYYFVGVFEVIDHELRVNQSDKMQRKNSILFKLKKISNDEDFHKTHITNIKNKSNDEMKCYLQKINEEFSNEWINYKLLLNNECKKKFNHSGVYIYKDEDKKIAYVGQAGSCTKRLIQHFDHIEFLSDSVVFKVIETTRLDDCEREWISKMKQQGYNLSNKTNGNNPY